MYLGMGSYTDSRKNARRCARSAPTNGSYVKVRHSPIHGRGVFATRIVPQGTRIIEYTGKRMAWADVPNDDGDPHTFIFSLDDGRVINAAINGNEARWINHSCDPNCEAVGEDDGIFIYALKEIRPGEELFYDYALQLDEPVTEELALDYTCRCGAATCRGTMLEL
jgi:SET domain-containing protein